MTIAPNLCPPRSQSAVPTAALNGRWTPKDSARAVLAWKQVGPPTIRGWHLRTLISGLGWWWKLLGGSGSGYPSPLEPLPQASAATIHSKLPANRQVPGPRAYFPNEFADGCRILIVLGSQRSPRVANYRTSLVLLYRVLTARRQSCWQSIRLGQLPHSSYRCLLTCVNDAGQDAER
jgi:hypothetical protein